MSEITKIKPASCKIEYEQGVISSIELIDINGNNHMFSEITVKDELLIPQPFGCPFVVTDISSQQWENQNYEVEFLSGYSREGAFTAGTYEVSDVT